MNELLKAPKKTYKEPRLRVYGNIQTLTQTVSMAAGQIDNGKLMKTA
ncbi:MAG TPA: hypothetical protein VGI34_02935 [Candidatus Acidoferrales bacterium]|jgi:hypothetical protein